MQSAIRNSKAGITFLLLLALAIRVGWVLHLPSDKSALWQLPDQVEYYDIAQNVIAGKGFHFWEKRLFGEVRPNSTAGDVHAFRMPGYPLFVAACGAKLSAVRVVQAILDTSTVLAAYLIARRLFGERAALLAAVLVAFNPFLIYFSGLMLSETVYVCMLAWGMLLLIKGVVTRPLSPCNQGERGRVRGERVAKDDQRDPNSGPSPQPSRPEYGGRGSNALTIVGIFVLALAIYIRPSSLLLPIVLPLMVGRNWKLPIIGAVMIVLVLLPWAIRNKRLLGEWVWTTTNGGVTLYDGFNPSATGASNQNFIKEMPQLKEMSEIERSQYLSSLARKYIANNLPRVVSLTLNKVARTWSPIPLSDQFGSRKLYRLVGGAFAGVLFLLAILAIFRSGVPIKVKLFLLVPAMYFTIVHGISVGSLRYRLPAEVPLAVLAGGLSGKGLGFRSRGSEFDAGESNG